MNTLTRKLYRAMATFSVAGMLIMPTLSSTLSAHAASARPPTGKPTTVALPKAPPEVPPELQKLAKDLAEGRQPTSKPAHTADTPGDCPVPYSCTNHGEWSDSDFPGFWCYSSFILGYSHLQGCLAIASDNVTWNY